MKVAHALLWALVPFAVTIIGSPWVAASETTRGTNVHQASGKPKPSIFVSATKVLCLAQQGSQPSGKPAPAKGKRPAGVAVYGVSGLGIGAKDGDVITEIMGQPVRSVAQGMMLIIGARAAERPVITGTLWRGMRSFSVAVEQPYTEPDCSAGDADCWRSHCAQEEKTKHKPTPGAKPKPAGPKQQAGN